MRRMMFVPLVALSGLLGVACEEPDTADPAPLDAFADVVTTDSAVVPGEQITSCVDATKYGAFVGETEASARWSAAGQSDTALAEACLQIGRADPAALAAMHWNWTAAQSSTTLPPAPVVTPAHDCDPSYPELCLSTTGPELACIEITERRFTVLPPDRHGFDRDNDGIGCEAD